MSLCVVHLVRAANGLLPLTRFLDSWRRHPAGVPHRLLLVLKGFCSAAELAPFDRLLDGLVHDRLRVPDSGYDIGSYRAAVRATGHERYCFLNSFSVILDDGWLEKLVRHATGAADLVGASGSWISHLTSELSDPNFGRRLRLGGRTVAIPRLLSPMLRARWRWMYRRDFEPFPNPHVRTNAIVVPRDLLLQARPRRVWTKHHALKVESAKTGLSGLARARGGRLLVVGRDGRAYPEDEWPLSHTFWQGNQENLLVADNQTERYAAASLDVRTHLSVHVWGDQARPEQPPPRAAPAA